MSFAVSRSPLAVTTLALAFAFASPAHALAARTTTVPTFPTPASARIPPSASTNAAPNGTTATTRTSTVPGAATAVPGTTSPSAPGAAAVNPLLGRTVPGSSAVNPLGRTTPNARLRARARKEGGSGHVSTEAIVLAAIAALLLLACAAWAFARSRAYEPHWLVSMRHAMAEAGFRTSATWAEFTDWARLGR